jgi:hypothetical protein
MSGRELIQLILASCRDLDSEVPCLTLERDSENCVVKKYKHYYTFISGRLLIELKGRELVR